MTLRMHIYASDKGKRITRWISTDGEVPYTIKVRGTQYALTSKILSSSDVAILVEPDHETVSYQYRDEEAAFAPRRDKLGGVVLRGKKEIRKFQDDVTRHRAQHGQKGIGFDFGIFRQ